MTFQEEKEKGQRQRASEDQNQNRDGHAEDNIMKLLIFFIKFYPDPHHYESLYLKGESLRKVLRLDEAFQVFELALFSNNNSVNFKLLNVFAYLSQEILNSAIYGYQNILAKLLMTIKICQFHNLQLRLKHKNDMDIFISNWK